ncbi:MAG: hypothetical protein ABI240_13340 [Sphingomonas sp.]
MTQAQRRYIAVETALGIVINALISIGFVWLVFGGTPRIATRALILDAVPQSFMIALMSTIVPTLLTRRRQRAGLVAGLPGHTPVFLRPLLLRATFIAVLAVGVGVAFSACFTTLVAPDGLSFGAALAFKAGYGGALGLIVTPITVQLALREKP